MSDCEGTAPAIPDAPANLVSSENPSTDGSFDLSWDAPTGTTPAGYLVYRSGSKSGYLTKTFANRTLSITGLSDGSYAYKSSPVPAWPRARTADLRRVLR